MAKYAVSHRGSFWGGCLGWLSGTEPDDPSGAGGGSQHAAALYPGADTAQHAPQQLGNEPHASDLYWDPVLQKEVAPHTSIARTATQCRP